jgi:hypothetical protein
MFLGLCNQLRVLDISNNVVTTKDNYRQIVKNNIPHLSILDQIPFEEMSDELKNDLTRSEYHSNVGQSNRLISSSERPSTALSTPIAHISIGKRPLTAEGKSKLKHDVSVGEPVCGSIIAKARSLRKMRTAWGESISSSSSAYSSSESSAQSTPASSAKLRMMKSDDQESSELLKMSKAWREKSRETREKYGD